MQKFRCELEKNYELCCSLHSTLIYSVIFLISLLLFVRVSCIFYEHWECEGWWRDWKRMRRGVWMLRSGVDVEREREREREREAFPITISRPMDHLFSRAFYQDLQSSRIEDPSNDRGGLRSLLSPHALSPDRIARYNERALSHITFVALQLPRFILTTPFNILFSIS